MGAREHNLKNIDVKIPKKKLVCFTGVSGSGKSSLVFDTIYAEAQRQLIENFSSFARRRLPKINRPDVDEIKNITTTITIDQKRLGNNPRSTVGTATEIYTYLRLLFSRIGTPIIAYDNAYDSRYFGFNNPYSGGETQRIKLARELHKKGNIYVLDEPTTGFHMADIEKLLGVINRLVDQGNTVIVIEHNLDVIKDSDWVIDLGPEGGSMGGEIIAEGTPEEIASNKLSYTGEYLKKVLQTSS